MSDVSLTTVDLKEFLAQWKVLSDEVPEVLDAVTEELAKYAQRLFEGTVRTWTRKPRFTILTEVRGDEITIAVGTDEQIYEYVDKGTGPRDIVPRKPGGVLVFRSVYKPRTRPDSLQSGRKWRGGALIFCKRVRNHRIKPRNFTLLVFRRAQDQAWPILTRRMKKFVRTQ